MDSYDIISYIFGLQSREVISQTAGMPFSPKFLGIRVFLSVQYGIEIRIHVSILHFSYLMSCSGLRGRGVTEQDID